MFYHIFICKLWYVVDYPTLLFNVIAFDIFSLISPPWTSSGGNNECLHSCNGENIFMNWKMECSILWGEAELNGTIHLSTNENILTIARMQTFIIVLFYIQVNVCNFDWRLKLVRTYKAYQIVFRQYTHYLFVVLFKFNKGSTVNGCDLARSVRCIIGDKRVP